MIDEDALNKRFVSNGLNWGIEHGKDGWWLTCGDCQNPSIEFLHFDEHRRSLELHKEIVQRHIESEIHKYNHTLNKLAGQDD
jgi:hypothetical protein